MDTPLGDKIEKVAKPVAKVIDTVFNTDLQNCGGCNQMKHDLNNGIPLWDALYDRFWSKQEDK